MSSFMDKVQAVENKFMDLEQQISDPSVIARQEGTRFADADCRSIPQI